MQLEPQSIRTFITDGSEHSTQNIISKLKFISKIKEGEKVDIQSCQVVDAEYWPSRIYRTVLARGESRNTTLDFIKMTIGEAFELCSKYFKIDQDFYQQIANTIAKSIQESKAGLKNLSKTYKDDRLFVSKVEALLTTLDTEIEDMMKQFPR
jgi:hypothetical protein